MNMKMLLGILLVIGGLIAAVAGISGDDPQQVQDQPPVVGDQNQSEREEAGSLMLPIVAGLSLAGGAALIGLGMGNFRRPTIVPPDSPDADEAATSRKRVGG